MDTSELKPCPLCGKSGDSLSIGKRCYGHGDYSIAIVCECGIEFSEWDDRTVIDKWNTRNHD